MKGILKRHSNLFIVILRMLDPAVMVACTVLFYAKGWLLPGELARVLAIYCGLLLLMVFGFFGLYKSWRVETIGKEIKTLAVSWATVLVLFNTLIMLLANTEQMAVLWPYGLFRVKAFWGWAVFVLCGLVGVRLVVRSFLRFIRKRGWNQRNIVIAGAGEVGQNLARYLQETGSLGIQVVGFFDDREPVGTRIDPGTGDPIEVLGNLKASVPYSVDHQIDIAIITLPMRAAKKINDLVWMLGLHGVNVMMAPDLFAFGLQKARVIQIGDIPVMLFNLFPAWKRIFDILFALAALIACAPVMLTIAWLIKKEDGGSVFYGHPRVREQGRPFKCLKFRTMHMNADKRLKALLESDAALAREWAEHYKLKNDPRITRIGRFLRKTSLDELPQFINVLRGEMSIVGARPVVRDELDRYYTRSALTYCAMKPGVTGPWQAGKRNDVEDYDERVRLDRLYVLKANLWLDLKIIFKTVYKMATGKGAY